ncbi:MAG: uracil-DNA glycosylase family protein [Candidatus Aminicenantales bacterium]
MEKERGNILAELKEQILFLKDIGFDFMFATPPRSEDRFLELREKILSCERCPLSQGRRQAVPGEGNERASLMFVGEAPGRDEDIQGRPFVGRAGQLLTKIIEAMGFERDEVYITNVCKCRPPENRTPHRQEIDECASFLLEQIEVIKPRVIVALGRVAADFFIPGGLSLSRLRGNFSQFRGIQVMPTFHPSYLVRNEQNRVLKKMVWEDMKKVMSFLGKK